MLICFKCCQYYFFIFSEWFICIPYRLSFFDTAANIISLSFLNSSLTNLIASPSYDNAANIISLSFLSSPSKYYNDYPFIVTADRANYLSHSDIFSANSLIFPDLIIYYLNNFSSLRIIYLCSQCISINYGRTNYEFKSSFKTYSSFLRSSEAWLYDSILYFKAANNNSLLFLSSSLSNLKLHCELFSISNLISKLSFNFSLEYGSPISGHIRFFLIFYNTICGSF